MGTCKRFLEKQKKSDCLLRPLVLGKILCSTKDKSNNIKNAIKKDEPIFFSLINFNIFII